MAVSRADQSASERIQNSIAQRARRNTVLLLSSSMTKSVSPVNTYRWQCDARSSNTHKRGASPGARLTVHCAEAGTGFAADPETLPSLNSRSVSPHVESARRRTQVCAISSGNSLVCCVGRLTPHPRARSETAAVRPTTSENAPLPNIIGGFPAQGWRWLDS